MTIFGARRDTGGKPRFLGLILTAVLLVFLAGVAAWASVFLEDGLNLSRLFGDRAPREEIARATPEPQAPDATPIDDAQDTRTAALSPELTQEDSAVLEALRTPAPAPEQAPPLTEQELEARYATTGIWPRAPQVPPQPAVNLTLDDLYMTGIDPVSTAADALALPPGDSFATDAALASVSSPVAAGTTFALDAQGLVVATAAGALSPDGHLVYLGKPPLVPPPTPTRFQSVPQDTRVREALAAFRPKTRPEDLSEQNERAQLDGLTRNELAGLRPRLRPPSVQEEAAAAAAVAAAEASRQAQEADQPPPAETAEVAPPSPFEGATRLAATASARPDTRPRNFARIVQRAQRTPRQNTASEETRVASTATVAPRTVTPKVPTKTTVAKQATVRNAINLRKVNLIGIYGKASSRRALVRLSNGRYEKVTVGDRLDGGRVRAIGDTELRYTKGSRTVVLKMP